LISKESTIDRAAATMAASAGAAEAASSAEDERFRLHAVAAHLKQQGCAQCPVCMDVLTRPARLLCRHSFCHGCIDTVLGLAQATGAPPRCPVCNVDFRRRDVVASEDMGQLVEVYRQLQAAVRRRTGAPPDSQEQGEENMPPPSPANGTARPLPATTQPPRQPRASARSVPKPARHPKKPRACAKARASASSAPAAANAAGPPDAAESAPAPAPKPRRRPSRPVAAERILTEDEQLALALKLSMQDERIQRQKRRHEDLGATPITICDRVRFFLR
jgi:hypothetical protein